MSNEKKSPPKGVKPTDKISEFLNLPQATEDNTPIVREEPKPPSPVENALINPKEDEYENDLRFVKDIQKDILSKGMELIDIVADAARSTVDPDTHDIVIKYIRELSRSNKDLMDLNRVHQSTQEARARTRKINKEIVEKVAENPDETTNSEVSKKYTIRTTSSDMLRMIKELEEEEAKKKPSRKKK